MDTLPQRRLHVLYALCLLLIALLNHMTKHNSQFGQGECVSDTEQSVISDNNAVSRTMPRDARLDNIRVLACLLVVLMHSPMPVENANGIFLSGISYITMPCIGLFFMISGALLLPVKTDMFSFLKRRLGKIVFPLLIWTALYLCLNIYNSESEINILQNILSIPFSPQGTGVLWFLYTLTGLYLLAPIISPWLAQCSRRQIELVLVLWAITLCYPVLGNFVSINTNDTGILYYFTGYAGYFLLGYYVRHYRDVLNLKVVLLFGFIGLAAPVFVKLREIEVEFLSVFGYLSIFTVMLCCVYYRLAYAFKSNRLITFIARYSFGIYLSHILIMRYILWRMPFFEALSPYPFQTLVIFSLTFLGALILCRIIACLPFSAYIIGNK